MRIEVNVYDSIVNRKTKLTGFRHSYKFRYMFSFQNQLVLFHKILPLYLQSSSRFQS